MPIWGGTNTVATNPADCNTTSSGNNGNPYLFEQCGNLTGAGTVVTPTDFNLAIARCTDASTSTGTVMWGTSSNAEENQFAADDSWLALHTGPSNSYVIAFNPSSMLCGPSGISYSGAPPIIADHLSPTTAYVLEGINETQLYQDTLPAMSGCAAIYGGSGCAQPSGSSHVLLFDFINSSVGGLGANFNCLQNPYNGYPGYTASGNNATGEFTDSADDTTFPMMYGNQNVNTGGGIYVAVWKKSYGLNGGCDIWNTYTGTLWKHDGSCTQASPCPITGSGSQNEATIPSSGSFSITSVDAATTAASLSVTSVTASAWSPVYNAMVAVYTGTIGGAGNAWVGYNFTVTSLSGGNITNARCVGSSASTLVLVNSTATGGFGSGNATSVVTVYHGTFTGGGSGAFTNYSFAVSGTCAGDGGTFTAATSTAALLTVNNPNGVLCSTAGTTVGTQVGPDMFIQHESFQTLSDSYIVVDTGSQNLMQNGIWTEGPYVWQAGTTTVNGKCGTVASNTCSGHFAEGFNALVVGTELHPTAFTGNPNGGLIPIVPTTPCNDNHLSWNSVDLANQTDEYPVLRGWSSGTLGAYSLLGGTPPPCAYFDEITLSQTTNPYANARAAHNFNTSWSWDFQVQNAITIESGSGRFAAWPTDGYGQFGNIDGTHAACNVGGPNWIASDSTDFITGTGFGSYIMPQSANNGNYVYHVASCAGTCTTGSAHPTWPQTSTPHTTVVDNTITWETAPDVNNSSVSAVSNCRSDILIVKLYR
jgi:hypothetical protein